MSEYLRELVVSLSLDSDNFSRNMRTINQQIKEAESTFRLAGAGVDNFESTVQGAQSKVAMLKDKLTQQNRAVDQYSRALDAANKKLTDSYTRQGKLQEKLQDARAEMNRTKDAVDSASATYKSLASSLGEADSATIAAKANMDAAQQEYNEAAAEVKKLEGQIKSNTKTLQNNADAISKAQTNLNNAKAAVKQTEAEIDKTNKSLKTMQSHWTSAGQAMETFGAKCQDAGKSMTSTGRILTATLTTPIAALGTTAVKASIEYESAFASVRKTVDATEEEYAALSGEIKQMSTVVATGADDIAEVVAIAGQLGIANNYLTGFSRTMIDLGNSTDIVADEAASTLAKFANITNMDQSMFSNLGSTLVDLGNKYATTESEIMNLAMRLAGAGHQVGLSESQILGFAAALSSVGINAEMGGSAFSKALTKMEVAAATGGDALDDFAEVSGMTAAQFKTLWDSDPAAAFQAFIVGLAKMDEAGESAIATLQEIGISEVRLRDTLLRSVNATELFAETQETANRAWEENTALSTEANKRYATTESRLKNLKNTATLFAQQIGDDLNPTINNLIDGASGLLEKFLAMDESQRMQIIQFAAVAAAAGPLISILGKLTSFSGKVTSTIGKFSKAVGEAGGGFKGFMKTLASSPAVWFAVAAGIMAGVSALKDYLSGAKSAREAIEDMNGIAKDLEQRGVKTFYSTGTGDVLARFGLNKADFQAGVVEAKSWIDSLKVVWADGKKESNELVAEYVDSFTSVSTSIRDGVERRRKTLSDIGILDDDSEKQMDDDLKQLDAWDAEIAKLLKKRQNKLLSEKDKARLDEIVLLRTQLQVEYIGPESGSYEKILQGIENEKSRALAAGESVQLDLFGDALTAAAQGQEAYLETLNAEYDTRRANLQLISDEAKRKEALALLDAWYSEQKQESAEAYHKTVAQIGSEAYTDDGINSAMQSIGELYALMQTFDGTPEALQSVQAWMEKMNGDDLASVLTLMTQLNESGVGDDVLGFDPSAILAQWQNISNVASAFPEQLEGLNKIINDIVPSEVQEVLISLNLDTAAQQWGEFIEGRQVFNVSPNLVDPLVDVNGNVVLNPLDQGRVSLWKSLPGNQVDLEGQVNTTIGLGFGDDWKADLDKLWAEKKLAAYGTNGLPIEVTPDVLAKLSGSDILLGMSEDGTYHIMVKPVWESATREDVDNAIEGLRDSKGAANGLFGTDILATEESEAIQLAKQYYAQYADPDRFKGLFVEWGWVEDTYLTNAEDIISAEGAKEIANAIATIVGALQNGEELSNDAFSFFYDTVDVLDYISKYGKNEDLVSGILQNLSALGINVSADELAQYLRSLREASLDALAIQEACTNASNYIEKAYAQTNEESVYAQASMAKVELAFASAVNAGVPIEKAQELVRSATSFHDIVNKLYGAIDEIHGSHVPVEDLNSDLAFLTAYCDAYYKAMQMLSSGDSRVTQDTLSKLDQMFSAGDIQGITETFNQLGISLGGDAGSGIGSGLAGYDFSEDASVSAEELEAALRTAYDSHSPANLTKPVGHDVAAGVGEGMKAYDMLEAASVTASNIKNALQAGINMLSFRAIGYNAMAGLVIGILAGRSNVISAMRSAAQAAVGAAKDELDIHSPSGVFENEVGVMAMRGWGEGVLKETKQQAQVIRNATRYLTGEAINGSVAPVNNDNRRTYNQNSSISFAGSNFYVRDSQDAYALAIEIASLTRRQQRGKGLRMA